MKQQIFQTEKQLNLSKSRQITLMVDIDQILKNDVVRSEKIQALKTREIKQYVYECQEDIKELDQC